MKRLTQIGSMVLTLLIGCTASHGTEVTCGEILADPSLVGSTCAGSLGACTDSSTCPTGFACRDGIVTALLGGCPDLSGCDVFIGQGGQAGDSCDFFDQCFTGTCTELFCRDNIAMFRNACTRPTITCEQFIVSNLPLGTECDEERFGTCGGQDEFCCGGPPHWCESGEVVAGAILDCECQTSDEIVCDAQAGTLLSEENCNYSCELGEMIAGIPCCTVSRSCDENNRVQVGVNCDDSCPQACDLIPNQRSCRDFGCDWSDMEGCLNQP